MGNIKINKIEKTLETLGKHELSTIERILLSSDSTVQTLLSVIHDLPVGVEVISQLNYDTVLVRWVNLYAGDSTLSTVALAESVIPYARNRADFIGAMGDRNVGIGQALRLLGVNTEREILGIYVNKSTISRSYRIRGDEIDILITETFDRELYRGLK